MQSQDSRIVIAFYSGSLVLVVTKNACDMWLSNLKTKGVEVLDITPSERADLSLLSPCPLSLHDVGYMLYLKVYYPGDADYVFHRGFGLTDALKEPLIVSRLDTQHLELNKETALMQLMAESLDSEDFDPDVILDAVITVAKDARLAHQLQNECDTLDRQQDDDERLARQLQSEIDAEAH